MATILVLHGPNLNLLGTREPEIYGPETLDDINARLSSTCMDAGHHLMHMQSNAEYELIDRIHDARREEINFIIFNPAALTHYGWSLHDALAAFEGPIVELHLSNPNTRESWRHVSVVAPIATGSIIGFGGRGYRLAVEAIAHELGESTWMGSDRSLANQSQTDTAE